jgi:uncharacterized protein
MPPANRTCCTPQGWSRAFHRRSMYSRGVSPFSAMAACTSAVSLLGTPAALPAGITSKAAVRMGLPAHAAHLVGWSGVMRTIGAISDTHGLLRPQALAALAGCDPIIHAGDVGTPDVLARLGALAPVHAVRGNVDHGAWSANLPVTQRIDIDGFRIYVLHILAELDPESADNVDAVIYGHSHQPKIETKNGILFFNPGSAGPRRFRLPITVGRMTAEHGKLRAEIVELLA